MGVFKSEFEKKFVIIVGSIFAIFLIVQLSKIIGKEDSCECVDAWKDFEVYDKRDSETKKKYDQCLKDWLDFRFAEEDCFNL